MDLTSRSMNARQTEQSWQVEDHYGLGDADRSGRPSLVCVLFPLFES